MRFTPKELRDATGWPDFQVWDHLAKRVDLEYLLVHRGRRGRQFVYELLYVGEGQSGASFLMGLSDPTKVNEFERRNGQFELSLSLQ